MFRLISCNLNGVRSARNKGFFHWMLEHSRADIICVQELKAQESDLSVELLQPTGFYGLMHYAQKKGYSGVGIYSKTKPDNVQIGLGIPEFDQEGRYIQLDFLNVSIVSLYLPSGTSGNERQQVKYAFLDVFMPILEKFRSSGKEMVICGDWNIAHQEIDLKNYKGNRNHSGFLPEERAWMNQLFASGWIDVWRMLYPNISGYTWWSNRGQAYAKDIGWRIDYHIVTPGIAKSALSASIYKKQKFSDHAPLIVDYDWIL